MVGMTDRTAASALERAITLVAPRRSWCAALGDALEAIGEKDYAVAWTQRMVAVLPGDRAAIEALLARVTRVKDGARLADALVWVLSQPQPNELLAELVSGPLRALADIDPGRAVAIAYRAVDVLGPQHAALRGAVMRVSERSRDETLAGALLERWIASGGARPNDPPSSPRSPNAARRHPIPTARPGRSCVPSARGWTSARLQSGSCISPIRSSDPMASCGGSRRVPSC